MFLDRELIYRLYILRCLYERKNWTHLKWNRQWLTLSSWLHNMIAKDFSVHLMTIRWNLCSFRLLFSFFFPFVVVIVVVASGWEMCSLTEVWSEKKTAFYLKLRIILFLFSDLWFFILKSHLKFNIIWPHYVTLACFSASFSILAVVGCCSLNISCALIDLKDTD